MNSKEAKRYFEMLALFFDASDYFSGFLISRL